MTEEITKIDSSVRCLCGCGEEVKPGNKFIQGHNWKNKTHSEGTLRKMSESKMGNQNGLGSTHSGEIRKKISDRMMGNKYSLGHKHTEESKAEQSKSKKGNKNPRFIDGKYSILNAHYAFKKQECIFGCKSKNYHLHHEPPIDYGNIPGWEGKLVNVCASCHQNIHAGKLFLPELSGAEWKIEQSKKLLEVK